jgi:hypothetical protein
MALFLSLANLPASYNSIHARFRASGKLERAYPVFSCCDPVRGALYHHILGRAVDPFGAAGWGSLLTQGMGRGMVASALLASTESDRDLVQLDYTEFLSRPADAQGLSGWSSALQQGLRDEALLAAIVASSEFFQNL